MKKIVMLFGMFLTFNAFAQLPQSAVCKNNTLCFKPAPKNDLATLPSAVLTKAPATTINSQPKMATLTLTIPVGADGKPTQDSLNKVLENLSYQAENNEPKFKVINGQTYVKLGSLNLVLGPELTAQNYIRH